MGHDISAAELDRALEPIRKIRAAVGHEIDVMVELHALWDVPAACRIVAALAEFDPFWIEDPVRVTSAEALAEVQRDLVGADRGRRDADRPARLPRSARSEAARGS